MKSKARLLLLHFTHQDQFHIHLEAKALHPQLPLNCTPQNLLLLQKTPPLTSSHLPN
jgi:hypothetical protein